MSISTIFPFISDARLCQARGSLHFLGENMNHYHQAQAPKTCRLASLLYYQEIERQANISKRKASYLTTRIIHMWLIQQHNPSFSFLHPQVRIVPEHLPMLACNENLETSPLPLLSYISLIDNTDIWQVGDPTCAPLRPRRAFFPIVHHHISLCTV